MKKGNWIIYISTIFALAVAILFFFNWNPENLLRRADAPVTLKDIEQDQAKNYTGKEAGADIPRLSGAEDFADMMYRFGYATAEPVGIVSTGVYTLKPWVNPNESRRINGRMTVGKRKKEIITSILDMQEDYNQYYLLKLPDHTYILAQIPPNEAAALKKGKSVTLPIGQKTGLTNTARGYLTEICEEYGVAMNGVLYTFDDAWYDTYYYVLFFLRFGAAAIIFFAISVGFALFWEQILKKSKKSS